MTDYMETDRRSDASEGDSAQQQQQVMQQQLQLDLRRVQAQLDQERASQRALETEHKAELASYRQDQSRLSRKLLQFVDSGSTGGGYTQHQQPSRRQLDLRRSSDSDSYSRGWQEEDTGNGALFCGNAGHTVW